MTEPVWEDIHAALRERGGYEVVKASGTDKQYRIAGRVTPDSRLPEWRAVRLALYYITEVEKKWTLDISKHYFPSDSSCTRELYEWRVIIQGSDLNIAIPLLLLAVQEAKPTRVVGGPRQVTEVPLVAGAHRNDPSRHRGKGAQSALTSIVGSEWKRTHS